VFTAEPCTPTRPRRRPAPDAARTGAHGQGNQPTRATSSPPCPGNNSRSPTARSTPAFRSTDAGRSAPSKCHHRRRDRLPARRPGRPDHRKTRPLQRGARQARPVAHRTVTRSPTCPAPSPTRTNSPPGPGGHWQIEALHWSAMSPSRRPLPSPHRQRTPGHGLAAQLAISLPPPGRSTNIAATLRHHARQRKKTPAPYALLKII